MPAATMLKTLFRPARRREEIPTQRSSRPAGPIPAASAPARQPTIFATFWHGPIDPFTYSCLASFPHHGARLRLYSYAAHVDAPPGVELADARTILPDETLTTQFIADGKPSYSKFSNLFRYTLIRQTGCCWVDADILCLKRPDFSAEPIVFGRQLAAPDPSSINNAVLKLPVDHPILGDLMARAGAVVGVDQPWGATGPVLFTELAERHGIAGLAHEPGDFYPLLWREFWQPLLPGYSDRVRDTIRGATFLHLWNEIFRRSPYDMSVAPPYGSFLFEIFRLLGTLPRFARYYGEGELRDCLGYWIDEGASVR